MSALSARDRILQNPHFSRRDMLRELQERGIATSDEIKEAKRYCDAIRANILENPRMSRSDKLVYLGWHGVMTNAEIAEEEQANQERVARLKAEKNRAKDA